MNQIVNILFQIVNPGVSTRGKDLFSGLNSKKVMGNHRNSGGVIPGRTVQLPNTNRNNDS